MPAKKRECVEESEELSGRFEYPDGAVYQGSYRVNHERPNSFTVGVVYAASSNNSGGNHDSGNSASSHHHEANSPVSPATLSHNKKQAATVSVGKGSTTPTAASTSDAAGADTGGRTAEGSTSTTPTLVSVKVRHGYGVYVDVSGTVYDGNWSDDAMSGSGTLRMVSGALYSGGFVSSKFHGAGCYVWPDGSYYDGEWMDNHMHGLGVYVDRQGRRWSGKFYRGVGADLVMDAVY